MVGADFRYGKGRAGTAETLVAAGKSHGFGVTVADLVGQAGTEISSTAIRAALSDGRPRDAAAMLGHWHRIDGEVFGGDRRGRELGYPTANMSIQGLHPPKFGIYAVRVDVLTGPHRGSYGGAASVGVRPMFGENAPNLETFLFDFNGDLYGEHLSVGAGRLPAPRGEIRRHRGADRPDGRRLPKGPRHSGRAVTLSLPPPHP